MEILVVKPTEAELAVLLSEHAHRFPQKAHFVMPSEGGEVDLPVLLGNPTGACKMPEGAYVSDAWDTTISTMFKPLADADSDVFPLVADSILWPAPAVWNSWCQRWAALPNVVYKALREKVGADLSAIAMPPKSETASAPVVVALSRGRSNTWRRIAVGGRKFDLVLQPPDSGLWRLFCDAIKKRDAKVSQLVRDLAQSCLVVAVEGEETRSADDLFGPFPGASTVIALAVSTLAGVASRYELGEW